MSHRSERRGISTLIAGILLLVLLTTALAITGCRPKTATKPPSKPTTASESPTPSPTPSTTPTPTPPPSKTPTHAPAKRVRVKLYFPIDEKLAVSQESVRPTGGIARATLTRLVQGPLPFERNAGMTTTIPKGTKVLSVKISNGIATADLSSQFASGGGTLSMRMRLAQVVFTLTQFPSVHGVSFELDGKPVDSFGGEGIVLDKPQTRGDFEDLVPAVFIELPGAGAQVTSPLRVRGSANTFEGVFFIALEDASHKTIVDKRLQTTGSGTRGQFDTTISWTSSARPAYIVGYSRSAKDGSKIIEQRYPIEAK